MDGLALVGMQMGRKPLFKFNIFGNVTSYSPNVYKPSGVIAAASDQEVTLRWQPDCEPDIFQSLEIFE
jgi:hypothetical protein